MTTHVLHDAMKTVRRHKGYGLFTLTGITLFALAWGLFIVGLVAVR